MGKVLLTKSNIDAYISNNQSKLYVDKNMILTSGARDVIRNKGISIIYDKSREEETEDGTNSEMEGITKTVIKILREQHGMTDAAQIKDVCNLILIKINKN
ncbi:conserved protein of unknown function [Petrocella atlantisensis]|uniref:Uncharacterized protein n=1 Tax=Petrocella atlantisensis TaxID=2173034 RepID=A0A3P7S8Y9_9FIRM|nr:hypothetical protein [Petrocella atlantisensis]VDN48399.1 conserved protein of unknown function [Petrocella atlantisensis]